MADIISANVTNLPARVQEKGVFNVTETYEPTSMAQNDVYYAVRVAPGVTVVGGLAGYDALGANTKIKLGLYSDTAGTAVDDDCFVTSTVTTSAGVTNFNGSVSTSWKNATTADYYVGLKQDDAGTAGGTIKISVLMTAETTDQV